MKLTKQSIQFCIDTVTAMVAQKLTGLNRLSSTDALRLFMSSETFNLLIDPKSYLYLESAEYTLDMFAAETKGDWERWLEV